MCQGLGPKKHYEISEIDRTTTTTTTTTTTNNNNNNNIIIIIIIDIINYNVHC